MFCFPVFLQAVLVLELFDTSAALGELLLSCKERMASGANVCSDLFLCGSRHKCVAACASYFTFLVLRMDSLFHAFTSFLFCFPPSRGWIPGGRERRRRPRRQQGYFTTGRVGNQAVFLNLSDLLPCKDPSQFSYSTALNLSIPSLPLC